MYNGNPPVQSFSRISKFFLWSSFRLHGAQSNIIFHFEVKKWIWEAPRECFKSKKLLCSVRIRKHFRVWHKDTFPVRNLKQCSSLETPRRFIQSVKERFQVLKTINVHLALCYCTLYKDPNSIYFSHFNHVICAAWKLNISWSMKILWGIALGNTIIEELAGNMWAWENW